MGARILSQPLHGSTALTDSAVLLVNLGTPDSPTVGDVRRYLNEFLMDPFVIDAPWPVRRALVGLILLTRPKQSAHAYQQIWDQRGSPLLFHSEDFRAALDDLIEPPVYLAMRYGSPSIASTLEEIRARGIKRLTVVALYPQFADSTVTTTRIHIESRAKDLELNFAPPFYSHEGFIASYAERIRPFLTDDAHLLLSFHGLPERHLTKADPTKSHCLQVEDCCNVVSASHPTCYRHQSYATAHAIRQQLALAEDRLSVSFQSRLGRLPWLRPYTDEELAAMPTRGIKNLVVACPAFVADNLETLEEIGLQGRETFLAAGGEKFAVVPCLNAEPDWVQAAADIIAHVS